MILVKLMGGLGNQMFQYAAAKGLACKHNVEVKVDVSFLNTDPKGSYTARKYELDIFNSAIKIATEDDLLKFNKRANNKITRSLQRNFPALFTYLLAAESGSNYNPAFQSYPKNTYLNGFWQSEKYFENYKEQIKTDFKLTKVIPKELQITLNNIQNSNSVSIHVRRGDYVALKSANDFHGICGIDYYKTAINLIAKKNKDINLYVFSDDINWCKQNFDFNFPIHFVEHNFESYWDMFLMSNCKHNIIANSSFSWWAAWLNHNEEKTVAAPKNWFADKTINTNDLIPSRWIKV